LLDDYHDSKFKIGESDSGRKLKVTLLEYIEYMLYNRDDSPLYLFESSLEEHPQASKMLKEYTPPKFFQQNFFTLVRIFSILSFFLAKRICDASAQMVSDWT
jgi:histone arginine demethylase JMJD6